MRSTFTRPFFTILFLACLLNSGKALTLSHVNSIKLPTFTYDSLKVFNWNMGSNYCKTGDMYPDCNSYIKDSVDKLISLGDKYDVLCLQGAPVYYEPGQKQTDDKFINNFVLKHKYSIVRKENSDLAILSRFPIQETGQMILSFHFSAKRISFWAAGKKYQVVNMRNANRLFVPDLEARKEDIRKTLRWMNSAENKCDVNILCGDFNMNYPDVENAIRDVKPFGLNGIPPRSCPGPTYCIYAWGETEWPYSMERMSNENFMYGVIYTKSFGKNFNVASNRAVDIKSGIYFLSVIGNKYQGEDLYAQFRKQTNFYNKFVFEKPVDWGNGVRIISPYDGVKYLYVNCQEKLSKERWLTKWQTGPWYHPLYWVDDFSRASKFNHDESTGRLTCLSCGGLQFNMQKITLAAPFVEQFVLFAGAQTVSIPNGVVLFKDI